MLRVLRLHRPEMHDAALAWQRLKPWRIPPSRRRPKAMSSAEGTGWQSGLEAGLALQREPLCGQWDLCPSQLHRFTNAFERLPGLVYVGRGAP